MGILYTKPFLYIYIIIYVRKKAHRYVTQLNNKDG